MKWILLVILLLSANAYSAQQYTEAECILLKHQKSDYKKRLGTNSSLYQKTVRSIDIHCDDPVISVKRSSQVLSAPNVNNTKQAITNQTKLTETNDVKTESHGQINWFGLIIKSLSYSWPLFLLALLVSAFRLPAIKGKLGELFVAKGLKTNLPSNQYQIINDVTLPLGDGGTTQIDHIVISSFGIFVIETKNMKGWIFGSEKQATWTQTIYRSKQTFQNPLRQNFKHIKVLSDLLKLPEDTFNSVIIFTHNSEFKSQMPTNVGHLNPMIAYIKGFKVNLLSLEQQNEIEKAINSNKLERGFKTNKNHVKYLKSKHG